MSVEKRGSESELIAKAAAPEGGRDKAPYISPDVDTVPASVLPAISGTDPCAGAPNADNFGDCLN